MTVFLLNKIFYICLGTVDVKISQLHNRVFKWKPNLEDKRPNHVKEELKEMILMI